MSTTTETHSYLPLLTAALEAIAQIAHLKQEAPPMLITDLGEVGGLHQFARDFESRAKTLGLDPDAILDVVSNPPNEAWALACALIEMDRDSLEDHDRELLKALIESQADIDLLFALADARSARCDASTEALWATLESAKTLPDLQQVWVSILTHASHFGGWLDKPTDSEVEAAHRDEDSLRNFLKSVLESDSLVTRMHSVGSMLGRREITHDNAKILSGLV